MTTIRINEKTAHGCYRCTVFGSDDVGREYGLLEMRPDTFAWVRYEDNQQSGVFVSMNEAIDAMLGPTPIVWGNHWYKYGDTK